MLPIILCMVLAESWPELPESTSYAWPVIEERADPVAPLVFPPLNTDEKPAPVVPEPKKEESKCRPGDACYVPKDDGSAEEGCATCNQVQERPRLFRRLFGRR